jgi:hypothetical protein
MADKQRGIHIITEATAILIGIFLIYTGMTTNLTWERPLLIAIGAANILLDGWLLTTWRKKT